MGRLFERMRTIHIVYAEYYVYRFSIKTVNERCYVITINPLWGLFLLLSQKGVLLVANTTSVLLTENGTF